MKKIFLFLVLIWSSFALSQTTNINGSLNIGTVSEMNAIDSLLVRNGSGLLGYRLKSSLDQQLGLSGTVISINGDGGNTIDIGPLVGANAIWGSLTGTLSNQTDLQSALDAKQDLLVSGTNIRTINGLSLLGSGDLVISGGGSSSPWSLNANTEYFSPNVFLAQRFSIIAPDDLTGVASDNYVSLETIQEGPDYYGEIRTSNSFGGQSASNKITSVPSDWNVFSPGTSNLGTHIGGTTQPTEKLQVTGNINVTGDYLINGSPISNISDHGSLAGLSDDDHPQYHTDLRAENWFNALYPNFDSNGVDDFLTNGSRAATGDFNINYNSLLNVNNTQYVGFLSNSMRVGYKGNQGGNNGIYGIDIHNDLETINAIGSLRYYRLADHWIFDDDVRINTLSGTGDRMVVANSDGDLSTQAIPSGGSGGSGTPEVVELSTFNGWNTSEKEAHNGKLVVGDAIALEDVLINNGDKATAADIANGTADKWVDAAELSELGYIASVLTGEPAGTYTITNIVGIDSVSHAQAKAAQTLNSTTLYVVPENSGIESFADVYLNPLSIDPSVTVGGNAITTWEDLTDNNLDATVTGAVTLDITGGERNVQFDGGYLSFPLDNTFQKTMGVDRFVVAWREGNVVALLQLGIENGLFITITLTQLL